MSLALTRMHALGAAFLAVLLGFVVFCVGAYNGWFTATAPVRLEIERAGLQLLPGSDVKLRGIIVGSVRSISSDGSRAQIDLELRPGSLELIPADVQARLVPKTLFGEKYVDLVIPPDASADRLAAGDVIPEDRSQAALELNRVLDNVLPLLKTVRPQDLSTTLNALSTALAGRGDQLGQTLADTDAYLKEMNPLLPQLQRDLVLLADVAAVYDEALPDLLAMLDDLRTTARTVVDEQEALAAFLTEVTGAAGDARGLLDGIGDDLVRVNSVGRSVVGLLEEYSPMFPCFFRGYAILQPQIQGATGQTPETEGFARIVANFIPPVPEYEYPHNLPEYTDESGPSCFGLPEPAGVTPKHQFNDGTEDDPRFASRAETRSAPPSSSTRPSAMRAWLTADVDAVDALLAPTMGVQAEQVPAIGGLLWAPVVHGTQVSLR
jgi:phospholipid/cholesterol/gamma-HCH transport system substrate-binding protein